MSWNILSSLRNSSSFSCSKSSKNVGQTFWSVNPFVRQIAVDTPNCWTTLIMKLFTVQMHGCWGVWLQKLWPDWMTCLVAVTQTKRMGAHLGSYSMCSSFVWFFVVFAFVVFVFGVCFLYVHVFCFLLLPWCFFMFLRSVVLLLSLLLLAAALPESEMCHVFWKWCIVVFNLLFCPFVALVRLSG